MEEITLNLIPTGVRPTCHVSQNDNERDIKINLVEGSLAYAIKSGDIVKLNIRKPNDVVISSRITATVGNTYVIANIKDEMCNVDGTNLCEIRIINEDTRISTSNFLMEVEIDPSANGGGGGGGASNLSDLDDVNISEPSNGQVLKYNGTSAMWENGTGGGGGASNLSDLDDVDLTGLEDGNSLVYDAESGTWIPQGAPAIHYFSNEHVIGTWLDGSTLYEKTIYYAGGSSGTITIPHNISNIGKCVDAFGTCHDQGYGSQHEGEGDMPLPRIATDGYNVGIAGVNVTNIVLGIANIWGSRIVDFYITLRYTKSST